MRVSVDIAISDQSFEIQRRTDEYFRDTPAEKFRSAAGVLREIADDIDRMYPTPEAS